MNRFLQTNQLIRFAIGFFVLLLLAVGIGYSVRVENATSSVTEQTISEAKHQLEFTAREFRNLRSQLYSLTRMVALDYRVGELLKHQNQQSKKDLEESWRGVLTEQHWLTGLHLIDRRGQEVLAAQVDLNSKQVSFGLQSDLQNYASNQYFLGAEDSLEDSISTWGVTFLGQDKRLENARMIISYPIVYQGVREGFVAVMYDINGLVSALNYSPLNHVQAEVVDSEGYFFSTPDSDKLFGHLMPERSQFTLEKQYPAAWQEMQQATEIGIARQGDTTLVYKPLLLAEQEQPMYGIVRITQQAISARLASEKEVYFSQSMTVILGGALLLIPGLYWFDRYQRRVLDGTLARAALEGMSAVVIANESGRIVKVNKEFVNMTGHPESKVIGRRYEDLILSNCAEATHIQRQRALQIHRVWQAEVQSHRADGSTIYLQLREQSDVQEKEFQFTIISLIDISSQKALEKRLLYLSEHDGLCNIWNRRKFDDELALYASLKARYPEKESAILAVIDIDHFKRVNDSFGHDVGDRVIKNVASYFTEHLRVTDFLARVGGEEFAVIMPHTDRMTGFRVLDRLRRDIALEGDLPSVSVSIGITLIEGSADESYKRADTALYLAKRDGRNRVNLG